MNYTAMNNALGHAGEDIKHRMAKYLGYKLFEKMIKCESCTIGKMKQKLIKNHKYG